MCRAGGSRIAARLRFYPTMHSLSHVTELLLNDTFHGIGNAFDKPGSNGLSRGERTVLNGFGRRGAMANQNDAAKAQQDRDRKSVV